MRQRLRGSGLGTLGSGRERTTHGSLPSGTPSGEGPPPGPPERGSAGRASGPAVRGGRLGGAQFDRAAAPVSTSALTFAGTPASRRGASALLRCRRSHGWPSASLAESRAPGGTSSALTKARASALTPWSPSPGRSEGRWPALMRSSVAHCDGPRKGWMPERSMYTSTPADHTSALASYAGSSASISGAMKSSVPHACNHGWGEAAAMGGGEAAAIGGTSAPHACVACACAVGMQWACSV